MSSKVTVRSIIAIVIVLVIAALVTLAGSQGSLPAGNYSLFALCAAIAFAVQWVAFLPAFIGQTERFYDITGSLTYLTLLGVALWLGNRDPRALLVAALCTIWALRLGSFLFMRIHKDGGDGRFDQIKPVFARFLLAWTLQGLWVLLTLAAALAVLTADTPRAPDPWMWAGAAVWLIGFAFEATADAQKRRHRARPENAGRFIDEGLWAWSRHPNYFGEIVLWIGISIIAFPLLAGWRYAMLISPVFVYLLLTRVSGVPLLAKRGLAKWGDEPEYQAYLERTPVLVPRPPRRA